jgi:multiple sugar transport system substrate-binding protein
MSRASKVKGLTRREFVKAGALLGGAAAVLPTRAAAPAVGDAFWKQYSGTTLRIVSNDHAYPRAVRTRLAEFEKLSGMKVEIDLLGWAVYLQRSDLEMSSGSGAYDMLWIPFIMTTRWLSANWLAPLSPMIDNPKITAKEILALDDYLPTALNVAKRENTIYGLPLLMNTQIMFSRTDVMQKIGLSAPPDTYDDMIAACKKIQSPEIAGFIARGTPQTIHWNFPMILQSYGGDFFADPPRDMTPTLNTDVAIKAAEVYASLLSEYSLPGSLAFDAPDVVSNYQQGRACFLIEDDVYLTQALDKSKTKIWDKLMASRVPRGPARRAPQMSVHGFGIPANTKNKEAAWLFMQWVLSPEMMVYAMESQNNSGMTRVSVLKSKAYKEKFTVGGGDIGAIREEAFANVKIAYRLIPQFAPIGDRVGIAIQQIASRQKSAKAAMDDAQKDVVEIVKKAGYKISA